MHQPSELPADLPEPVDDGAADHLPGTAVPTIALPSTAGTPTPLASGDGSGRLVAFVYPRMSPPGEGPPTPDWDTIPGARGCTPEACRFRDLHGELQGLGAAVVGISTQPADEQSEAVARLGLPYPLLSDESRRLSTALGLPTFEAAGRTLLRRITLVIEHERIAHVFYPVFPPDRHADEVLAWLTAHPPPVSASS